MITLRLVFGTMFRFIIFAGCRKQIKPESALPIDPFVTLALQHLRQNLPESQFCLLSTDSYVYLNKSSGGLHLIRFFVKGDVSRSVTVSQNGQTITSSWFEMKDRQILSPANRFKVSGTVDGLSKEISVANGHVAEIISGFGNDKSVISIRQSGDQQVISKTLSNGKVNPESTPQWLPEFTVIAQVGGQDRTFYSLFWLTNMDPLYLNAYTNINPYAPIDAGGLVGVNGEVPTPGDEIVIIETYEYENAPAIKLEKIIKCFDDIPNAGAKYSMTMYVDIPVNDDPTQLSHNFSPGHTFLSMTKSNGQLSTTQVFGFYPQTGTLSLFGTAVKSKMRDNSEHEFDASITIDDVDVYSFKTAAYLAQYYANGMHYDINDFNCTDFAIDVFNKARPLSDQITVQDWFLNSVGLNCGTTPNGLYELLNSAKISNPANTTDITVGTSVAPIGKGECN